MYINELIVTIVTSHSIGQEAKRLTLKVSDWTLHKARRACRESRSEFSMDSETLVSLDVGDQGYSEATSGM